MTAAHETLTLVDVARRHALERGGETAFVHLHGPGSQPTTVTFRELDERARAVAGTLAASGLRGERVLLLCPSGPDYVAALFGCFYAGVAAVPAYPPTSARLSRATERIRLIADDCGAKGVLTVQALRAAVGDGLSSRLVSSTHLVDRINLDAAAAWSQDWITPATPAVLQYTSGSTSSPKGVLIDHGNVLANQRLMSAAFRRHPGALQVSWLPPYHDMGLFGGILNAFHDGCPSVLLPTEAFLRRPVRWLQAISEHRAQSTVAPNFAYDLCVRRIRPADRAQLDLSTLRHAFCGAEPINRDTLERFAQAFEPHGFRREAFYPCYGLAEATLMVSGGRPDAGAVVRGYMAEGLERGLAVSSHTDDDGARPLVGCGSAQPGEQIRIVDPETRLEVGPRRVGEVWVSGPSIARGYWNRPQETQETFAAEIADTGDGPFLRTGDLGFFDDGELFITGRLKDLIIVRGVNHYPHDIERTVQGVHPSLLPDSGAAFAIEADDSEQLVVAQEVHRSVAPPLSELIEQVAQAIREEHDLAAASIVLIKKGSALKTASGKIQRRAMRTAFLNGELQEMHRWDAFVPLASTPPPAQPDGAGTSMLPPPSPTTHPPTQPTQEVHAPPPPALDPKLITYHTISSPTVPGSEPAPPATYTRPVSHRREQVIAEYLRETIATKSGRPLGDVDLRAPLAQYGVDSLMAAELLEDLEGWLGMELPTTLSYDNPTILSLARTLARAEAGQTQRPRRPTPLLARSASDQEDPIAVVGMACRFPGAPDLPAYWDLLRHGRDAISDLPAGRWDAGALLGSRAGEPGKMVTARGGYLEDIDRFDAAFFGIGAHEADRMDPQQRLFLEVAWEALEDAGQSPDLLAGTDTGVFAGVSTSDYAFLYGGDLSLVDMDYGTGASSSVVANRVSYLLDLKGPSETIDAACASSLVALQHACQAVRGHDCELAIVGGVNAVLAPEGGVYFSQLRALSPSGQCRSFDASADGFVRSEGCGVVVLKRLSRATADGDRVYALIAGSAVNHDGRSNGLLAPNGLAQQKVVRKALRAAGIGADELDYVEAHGVGTAVADAVELRSLAEAVEGREGSPLLVGSAKTNVGHLEAASGMVSLIKTALALHHEQIPPHLHLREKNTELAGGALPLDVATTPVLWKRGARPRFGGVSSFGFGGTNAHVILREAPLRTPMPGESERDAHLLTLSARSEAALRTQAGRVAARLDDQPLADVCYTANVGRSHLEHRLCAQVSSLPALRATLERFSGGAPTPELEQGHVSSGRQVAAGLVFPRLQVTPSAAYALYDAQPEFRQALAHADAVLRPLLEVPLLSVLYGHDLRVSREALARTSYQHAATLGLQYAMHTLLHHLGVEPAAVLGSGAGEYAAAAACGVFSWEEALVLATCAGQVVEGLEQPGSRRMSLRELRERLEAVDYLAPSVPLVSASLQRAFTLDELPDAEHWARQLYRPPAAGDGADALARERCDLHLVLGPGDMPPATAESVPALQAEGWIGALSIGGARDDSLSAYLRAVARAFVAGVNVDWVAFDRPYPRSKLSLPGYPFERRRHWLDFPQRKVGGVREEVVDDGGHPLISRMRVRKTSPSGFQRRSGVPTPLPAADDDESTGS